MLLPEQQIYFRIAKQCLDISACQWEHISTSNTQQFFGFQLLSYNSLHREVLSSHNLPLKISL